MARQSILHGSGIYWGQAGDLGETPVYQAIDENFVELYTNQSTLQGYFTSGLPGYGESGGAVTASDVDTSTGNMFTKTIGANTTFTFTNSFTRTGFTLILTNPGAYTITWPASVNWPGGTEPTWTAAGVDIVTFLTADGGTTWYGTAQADFK
jgi:hypothetical protein